MSQELICPQCKQSFRDDEYCPWHGVRLVPPAAHSSEIPAQEADEAPVNKEAGGKLASIMRKLGLRPVANTETLRADAPAADEKSPLPPEVIAKGWRTTGPVASSAGIDAWPVERSGDGDAVVPGRFLRFRLGSLTTPALYRRCEERTTPQLARVWSHGTVDFGAARADYELVSLPKAGRGLSSWLQTGTRSEQRAWHLLPLLTGLLRRLAESQVRPLSLEPDWLQYTDDGELWLASAAVLTDVTATHEYHAEFARSPLLAHGWTAPELTQQNMLSANSAVFSVGQLLAQAVWGEPCSLTEVQTGAIPFPALADARLARVLMGCLWPRASERWTVEQLLQAASCDTAETMPATPPWASLAPGAACQSFAFAGESYWRLEDLLGAANKPAHWDEAITRIELILAWAEGTVWAGQVALMRNALTERRSADWVLVALTRAVLPDTPPTWRALDLSNAEAAVSLAGLAQRALNGGVADTETMRALFEANLRGAFTNGNNE